VKVPPAPGQFEVSGAENMMPPFAAKLDRSGFDRCIDLLKFGWLAAQ
jgi:hypothetical protein